ncbi:Oxo-4-hydroxy-4-carboxy-5-ureidoimidazoline decarboxylase [Lipomyces japonicus]|uniref:Oxo-4-hydroxy-4-carboxy-5-ureidoimidazoline decarboxylase n=1 Tax=Lipomyces japonicus TaxID=56871 RepID=UPI0034CEDBED
MSSYVLPSPASLGSLSTQEWVGIIAHLFEPSPALESFLLPHLASVTTYTELIELARTLFYSLGAESTKNPAQRLVLFEILAAHPRLGARKVESVHSIAEQASLQGETERFEKINKEYEVKFPGLRYVVFVNGRSRDQIFDNARQRIDRADYELEKKEAINAICDIAIDRAKKFGALI